MGMSSFLRINVLLMIILFVGLYLCDKPTTTTTDILLDKITYCLSHENISNFTVYPYKMDSDSPLVYFKLLNFSIQNLRYAEPTVPKPIAIILPETKEQLIDTFLCCRRSSSSSSSLEIRVRSGGHGYEGTSSSVATTDGTPFVIIDLMNLNRVSVDLESETAWVEGGATLGETYSAIAKSSKVHGFSAGSCPTVGIGGHIAGGGFGLLSRKYGVAADNVVDAILVDADGRLLNRQGMGEDVFWAIRGGGGGIWGIVHAWKIKLSRVPETVTGFIVSRPDTKRNVAKLVHKWQFVAPNLHHGFYLSVFVGANLPETNKTIAISATFKGFYLGPRSKAVSILNRVFPELGIKEEDCKEMSWIESILFFSGLLLPADVDHDSSTTTTGIDLLKDRYLHDKGYFKAKSDYVRVPISISGIRVALDILDEEPKGYVIWDPYGGVMQNISCESIPFPHRNGNLFNIQYLVAWGEEEEDNSNKSSRQYMDWIRRLYHSMTPYVSAGPRAAYVNYMDLDLGVMEDETLLINTTTTSPSVDAVEMARVWGEKYFLNNYDRLVRAKTLIDPHNIFKHQQGIPPLSSSLVSSVRAEV
ncbi:berberine bridge enzyme-like D-2 [Cornus florida]|uniref:berberine bridge enzyme-like D-2 n=1 Tax=Cornus florida TaxID=4283 RepID=UPI002898A69C|nr:berberine bridge enzyme-like D-2 [Cornus florida]